MSEAERDGDIGRYRERWSFKMTGKGAGRDGEAKRGYLSLRYRFKAGPSERSLREIQRGRQRLRRSGRCKETAEEEGRKARLIEERMGGQRKSLGAGKTARASEQEGGGR